jgi:hypothetical protein
MAGMLDKLKSSAADVAAYPGTVAKQVGAGLVGYNRPVSATPFYDAAHRQGMPPVAPGPAQKLGAAAADILTLPFRGAQAVGNMLDPVEVPAVGSLTPYYDRVRGMIPPVQDEAAATQTVKPTSPVPPVASVSPVALAPAAPAAPAAPITNPATPEQQAALGKMGITQDRVVNQGVGMTLDAARTMQAKAPTDKFYQLSGYGDQNSIYASAGKGGQLNTFSGAGTGKTSWGMPTPDQVAQAQALADKDIRAARVIDLKNQLKLAGTGPAGGAAAQSAFNELQDISEGDKALLTQQQSGANSLAVQSQSDAAAMDREKLKQDTLKAINTEAIEAGKFDKLPKGVKSLGKTTNAAGQEDVLLDLGDGNLTTYSQYQQVMQRQALSDSLMKKYAGRVTDGMKDKATGTVYSAAAKGFIPDQEG